MSVITVLLFVEYRFFKHQAETMIALKEDYQNHLVAINRVLQDYNKTKEKLEQLETTLEGEKKKLVSGTQAAFPVGARVFSSDDESTDVKDAFIVINRESEYLKQSNLGFLKEHKLDNAMQRVKHQDVWADYTERLLENQRTREQKPIKKAGKRRQPKMAKRSRRSQEWSQKKEEYQKDITLTWPIERSQFWLSSFFGPRKGPGGVQQFHYGLDMAAVRGTPVYPAADGVVVEARTAKGYGKTVVVAHNRKYRTRYAHLHTINCRVGQNVTTKTMIGKVGSTGTVRSKKGRDASHLHLEVCVFGKKVNPMYFFS